MEDPREGVEAAVGEMEQQRQARAAALAEFDAKAAAAWPGLER